MTEKRKAADIRIEDNPNSELNKKWLVTRHYGARHHTVYHGNNENVVTTLMNRAKIFSAKKRKQGVVRVVTKLWTLAESVREPE